MWRERSLNPGQDRNPWLQRCAYLRKDSTLQKGLKSLALFIQRLNWPQGWLVPGIKMTSSSLIFGLLVDPQMARAGQVRREWPFSESWRVTLLRPSQEKTLAAIQWSTQVPKHHKDVNKIDAKGRRENDLEQVTWQVFLWWVTITRGWEDYYLKLCQLDSVLEA